MQGATLVGGTAAPGAASQRESQRAIPTGFAGIYDPLWEEDLEPPASIPRWTDGGDSSRTRDHPRVAERRLQWFANAFALLDSCLSGELSAPPDLWARDEDCFSGGQLADYAEVWEDYILPGAGLSPAAAASIVKELREGVDVERFFQAPGGYDSDGTEARPPPTSVRNHSWEDVHAEFVAEEVARMVAVGAAQRCAERPRVVMALGVEPNKPRLIYDARPLNEWCLPPVFKMDSLRDFARGLHPGDFMISVDHKSGYHHVPFRPSSRKWMGFSFAGQFYTYNAIPFGWNASCYVYQRLSSVLSAYLRNRGIHCISYLDDFAVAISAKWPSRRQRGVNWAVPALHYLAGYTIGWAKCSLRPRTHLQLLGFIVDSKAMSFRMLPEKREARTAALKVLACAREVSESWLRSEVGRFTHLSLASPTIPAFLRSFHEALSAHDARRRAAGRGRRSYASSHPITVSEDMRQDAAALAELLSDVDLIVRWPDERHSSIRLDTDASTQAWGAQIFPEGAESALVTQNTFPPELVDEHITFKELYAVVVAIETFEDHVKNSFVDVHTDNTATEAAVAKFRTRSAAMRPLLQRLARLTLRLNLVLQVFRVTTKDNTVADELSRYVPVRYSDDHLGPGGREHGDHMLLPHFYRSLLQWAQERFTMDVCANARNRQVWRFISRTLEDSKAPGFVAANVLTYAFRDARDEFLYVNPPWAMLSPLWRHLRLCRTRGVLLFPSDPNIPCFGSIMADSLRVGCLASAGDEAFAQPSRGYRSSVGPIPWDLLVAEFDFTR